jgi:hypothetical protein
MESAVAEIAFKVKMVEIMSTLATMVVAAAVVLLAMEIRYRLVVLGAQV